ncbi:MAG: hypothetical protein H6831_12370 [Planctomycetes bacterium]|nr:hypothetical protein [Planctomycetota bacterium]
MRSVGLPVQKHAVPEVRVEMIVAPLHEQARQLPGRQRICVTLKTRLSFATRRGTGRREDRADAVVLFAALSVARRRCRTGHNSVSPKQTATGPGRWTTAVLEKSPVTTPLVGWAA